MNFPVWNSGSSGRSFLTRLETAVELSGRPLSVCAQLQSQVFCISDSEPSIPARNSRSPKRIMPFIGSSPQELSAIICSPKRFWQRIARPAERESMSSMLVLSK